MFIEKYSVNDYELDIDQKLKTSVLMKYMQQTARKDFTVIGASYEVMRSENMVFVLVGCNLKVFEYPCFMDEITVETWHRQIDGVIFIREFIITKNGKKIACAVTHWVLVDFDKRHILRPSAYKHKTESTDRFSGAEIVKMIPAEGDYEEVFTEKVRYSQLDYNGHMNNTIYMDIVADSTSDIVSSINDVQIEYKSEAKKDDSIKISRLVKDDRIFIRGFNETQNKMTFTAYLKK